MAGAPGFEPGNGGTKNRCLTAWRRPIGTVPRLHNRRFYLWQPKARLAALKERRYMSAARFGIGV